MSTMKMIQSTVVPLNKSDIDTDQIIPARYLKSTEKAGFGKNLFRDWRYNEDGSEKTDFILNNPTYKGQILIAGHNFGCGSSREHAAWALVDYGFKAVISSFFSDIFRNNALNNRLLPIQVNKDFLSKIFQVAVEDPKAEIQIDIEKQQIAIKEKNLQANFEMNPYKKMCIINNYDDTDYLISMKDEISKFEQTRQGDYSI